MNQELERVYDDVEVVEDQTDIWDAAVSEWASGHAEEFRGRLRQARAVAAVETRYGHKSVEAFADEVGAGRSKAYAYAAAYNKLLKAFGDHDAISRRLDDSPLRISHVLEAAYEEPERIPEALDRAEDEGLTTRQQQAERRERSIPENVETITNVCCVECGCVFELSRASTWTEAR